MLGPPRWPHLGRRALDRILPHKKLYAVHSDNLEKMKQIFIQIKTLSNKREHSYSFNSSPEFTTRIELPELKELIVEASAREFLGVPPDPGVLQGLVDGEPLGRLHYQQVLDQVFRLRRHILPVVGMELIASSFDLTK